MVGIMSKSQLEPPVAVQLSVIPGLSVTAVAVAFAMTIHEQFDVVSPLVIAAALGAVFTNTVGVSPMLRPGIRVAAKRLLRVGVVVLGVQLSFRELGALGLPGLGIVVLTVTATFFGTRWMGKRLGLSPGLSLLVATGFSICGASAIAAVEGVADADEEEVAFAIALVTLCGTLAIFVLPTIGAAIGLDGPAFGNWVGASVHDVGQVVATATPGGPDAVKSAVIVKLTRVVLLAPLVAGLSIARSRRSANAQSADRPPILPLFVVGFLAAIAVRSAGLIPTEAVGAIKTVQTVLLAAAMFGLGVGVHVGGLRKIGSRPLLLGLISWLLVALVAFGGTKLVAY